MAAGSAGLPCKYRIIENYETGKFELQRRKWFRWEILTESDDAGFLEHLYKSLRKGYKVVKELN